MSEIFSGMNQTDPFRRRPPGQGLDWGLDGWLFVIYWFVRDYWFVKVLCDTSDA